MILIPAILETHRSMKDKSLKLVFGTNELSPEQILEIANNLQKFGYLAFKDEPFKQAEIELISQLKTDFEETGKTPSQRLRAVIYKLFDQDKNGFTDFDSFYKSKMEAIINHFKSKLV